MPTPLLQVTLGRRIAKKVNGVIVEKYLWQGQTTLLAVYDNSDNLLMRFEYGDGRLPLAMSKDDSTYYLCYDQVGTLRAVSDTDGNIVKELDYDTFGNIITDSNPDLMVPFGFAGGLHDHDTGLVRFGARDYDPEVGRWTAKDPIFFAGGDTDLFGYVLNDPVNFVDPKGLTIALPLTCPNGQVKKTRVRWSSDSCRVEEFEVCVPQFESIDDIMDSMPPESDDPDDDGPIYDPGPHYEPSGPHQFDNPIFISGTE